MQRTKQQVVESSPSAKTPVYNVLPESDVHKILDATFKLMKEIGVAFDPDPRVLDRFADAGCEITSDHTVKFKRELVEECLETVAKSIKIWNRDGSDYIETKEGVTSFFTGMTCIQVFDLKTGERRDSTYDDIATIARVADALPNIDGVCTPVKDVPNSTLHGEIGEFIAMAENTTKPLEYLCEDSIAFEAAIEMAAAIRGGMDKLAEKPYFTQVVTPLPLYFAKTHSDQIILGAECGVPVTSGTVAIGGGTGPITVAGSMTHCLATDFAAITLSQLVKKGSFCHGSSESSFMEPATGILGNAIPDMMADMAIRQVRGHYGLVPLAGGGGGSSSPFFNQDAVLDISSGLEKAFFLQGGTLDYLGIIDDGMTYSLHALLLCNDLAGKLRHMWQGFPVDDEHLALDVTRSVGPKGSYLGAKHSVNHCRDNYWKSRYFGANTPLSSNRVPKHDLVERIDKDLREILANHQLKPMPKAIKEQVRAVHAKFETSP